MGGVGIGRGDRERGDWQQGGGGGGGGEGGRFGGGVGQGGSDNSNVAPGSLVEKQNNDDWMDWDDEFEKCVDNLIICREKARDHDEEALSHNCMTPLQRERREIFVHRWQKISGIQNTVEQMPDLTGLFLQTCQKVQGSFAGKDHLMCAYI